MDNSEVAKEVVCELPQEQSSLLLENNHEIVDNSFVSNDIPSDNPLNSSESIDQKTNPENQTSAKEIDVSSLNAAPVAPEASSVVPADDSLSSLPPLPKGDKDSSHAPVPYSADYNAQNYANYNYMYGNYSNYYGYPYPQYQWDYSSQQYYQPYQNYYNYNFNANQTQPSAASKPPPPPPDSVQLPVEEKPSTKTNTTTGDDSNRYSPTAETDDDDTAKGLPENKLDSITPQPVQTAKQLSNSVPFQSVTSEQVEIQKELPGVVDGYKNNVQHPSIPLVTPALQSVSAHIQQSNVPVQSSGHVVDPKVQTQTAEVVKESKNQQQNPLVSNGKDDSVEKSSKGSTVLGKNQAKKRLMAFSMMKQKLQEQNSSTNDNQSSDFVEGNDEFIPELNIFQTVQKKKVVANKKVIKVIKAQQTIEQIEEMKKDEMMQGNNAALYQHLLRSGGNEAPILQKLGIESLADKYSAKMKERGKRLKRHHHRHRDDRRGHKYHRRSHPKSRSRSPEKPKMRALDVKSWKDFVSGGFQFDKFRRFKLDEAEELKDKERKLRKKKLNDSQSDGKHQNVDCTLLAEAEKCNEDAKLRYNLLDQKKEILKGLEVVCHETDSTKDFPSYIIRVTKTKPAVKFSHNPAIATYHLQNRRQMLETLLPEIEAIVHKFFSSIKPKKLKENSTDINYNSVDDKLLLMMNNKNVYPFKGWWPKTYFIMTQVRENPNIEIDKDALLSAVPASKRTKKSRFDDDTSMTDLRPTVPSKWDSDYDDSPIIDKMVDIEVSQNNEMNTNNIAVLNDTKEIKTLDVSHREEPMDTASDIGDNERKIEVNVVSITHALPQEPQSHAKLDTEYEEFLKIACVEDKNDTNNDIPFLKVHENNLSVKSTSLNESVQDESEDDTSKSSDESIPLHNAIEESINQLPFVKSLSSFDKKSKKKKNVSSKKSKKYKKKASKKKKNHRNSSSSESSLESESESDSSSEDSESETSDSISTVERKKKKNVSKDKKKKEK